MMMIVDNFRFIDLPEELVRITLSYLDIPSLGALSCTGKNLVAHWASHNDTWKLMVEHRFYIDTKNHIRPNCYGGTSWKQAFQTLARADHMPKSRYTYRRRIVVAKGTTKKQVHLWVLLRHTENCTTRIDDHRYVELNLCIQNVRSTSVPVRIQVNDATLVYMGSEGRTDFVTTNVICNDRIRPKRLYPLTQDGGILLHPFEFAVVSVSFPCAPNMMYETDFLSRAVSVHVPIEWEDSSYSKNCYEYAIDAVTPTNHRLSAHFLPEHDIWNHYMELPGGCLALTNQCNLRTL